MSRLPEGFLSKKPFITLGAVLLCALAIAVSFGGILYVANNSKNQRAQTCEAVQEVRDALIAVLYDAAAQDPRISSQQFYARSITRLKKAQCNA